MFDDVPEELNSSVLDAPDELKSSLSRLHYLASSAILHHYLGTSFVHDKSPFLTFPARPQGQVSWEYLLRAHQIAEAVFSLRNEPGFGEITRRLRSRDLRSAYFESFAATMFQQHGFSIHARAETLVTGEDFDFSIRAVGVEANVEATALTGAIFNPASIRNALGKKRKQLPPDKPAIIVCFVPGQWRDQAWPFDPILLSTGEEFMRRTQKINWLFLAEDRVIPHGDGGIAFVYSQEVKNKRPRHPSDELDRLLDQHTPINHQSRDMLNHLPKTESAGTGQLIAWVDWLMSR